MCNYEGNKKKGEGKRELENECRMGEEAKNLEEDIENLNNEQLNREEIRERELSKEEINSERLNREKCKNRRKLPYPLIKIFGIAVLITGVLMGLVALTGVTVYKTFIYHEDSKAPIFVEQEKETNKAQAKLPLVPTENLDKTVAVFGTDITGKLTDVIFILNFNEESKKVNVIAVPRDTKVEWTKEQIEAVPSRNQWVRTSKINEMTSLGSIENIRILTIQTIEQLMGIKVDEYVIVNLNAFREIVDAIGGVEVEVKQRMKKDDFSQNLHIDLQPGLQILDGNKAEQFVRFRSYKTGDIGRIEAQQQFLKAFAKKVLSPEIIVKLPEIATIVYDSIKTDIGFTDIFKYLSYVKNFQLNNLYFYTLPGEAHYEGNLSYYFLNQEEVTQLVDNIFFKTSN